MANNISVTISGDCEAITVKMIAMSGAAHTLQAKRNGAYITLTPNTFPNPVQGQIISLTFTASQLQTTTVNQQVGTAAELSGVYMFSATDGTNVATGGVVAACNLDCCIANEINEYITKFRMDKAIILINNGHDSIRYVSEKVGFADSNYFSKCFKKQIGVSPSQYKSTINKEL